MKSIIPGDREYCCFICGSTDRLECHHIFGASDRDRSEELGLKVHLCYEHHHGTYGAHGREGKNIQQYLHETGQQECEARWMAAGLSADEARDRFRKEFRKSYL